MQRNSLGAAHDGGPVVLRPVRTTPCFRPNGNNYNLMPTGSSVSIRLVVSKDRLRWFTPYMFIIYLCINCTWIHKGDVFVA